MSLEGARWFSEGIKNHTIHKKYYGLVQGKLEETQIWQDKLTDSEKPEDGFYTVEKSEDGVLAYTTATPLSYGHLNGNPVTLVEFAIKTGRKHQIRIQSSIHKHPLCGDKAYKADKVSDIHFKREYYLEAFSLSFPPDNPMDLTAEIKMGGSPDFKALLEYCEIENPGL